MSTGSVYPVGASTRASTDAPARFLSEDMPLSAAPADTIPGSGCRSPLVDPRDGTRVRMLNSQRTVADYEVPAGRYGVARGEGPRIECNTGIVVGVVPLP
jgi:hypothetical protein